MDELPEGIIITISQGMLKEKGYRNWLRNFLQAMALHELGHTYWMRQGAKPSLDKHLQYVYLCIGGKVRFRAYYAGTEAGCEKVFPDGAGGTKVLYARAWIILAGPVERAPRGQEPVMKGFRGFRYTQKLF